MSDKSFKIVLTKFDQMPKNSRNLAMKKQFKFKCYSTYGSSAYGSTIPEAWKNFCKLNGFEIDEKGQIIYDNQAPNLYNYPCEKTRY